MPSQGFPPLDRARQSRPLRALAPRAQRQRKALSQRPEEQRSKVAASQRLKQVVLGGWTLVVPLRQAQLALVIPTYTTRRALGPGDRTRSALARRLRVVVETENGEKG